MIEDTDDGIKFPSASQWVRGFGAVIGLTMMILGVLYSVRIFGWIVEGLRHPEKLSDVVKRWGEVIDGGDAFSFMIDGAEVRLSELLGLLILGFGMLVLVKIAFLFLTEGSNVISNMLGDKEAIKKILKHTFGPGQVKDPTDSKNSP